MSKTIEELFELEKRDPWSIMRWLKAEGIESVAIVAALNNHAQRLANKETFGYENGISILSNSVREEALKADEDINKIISSKLGLYKESMFHQVIRYIKDRWKRFGSHGDK